MLYLHFFQGLFTPIINFETKPIQSTMTQLSSSYSNIFSACDGDAIAIATVSRNILKQNIRSFSVVTTDTNEVSLYIFTLYVFDFYISEFFIDRANENTVILLSPIFIKISCYRQVLYPHIRPVNMQHTQILIPSIPPHLLKNCPLSTTKYGLIIRNINTV